MFDEFRYHRVRKFVFKSIYAGGDIEHTITMDITPSGYLGGYFGVRNPLASEFGFACLHKFGDAFFQEMLKFDPQVSGSGSWRFPCDGPDAQIRMLDVRAYSESELIDAYSAILATEVLPFVQPVVTLTALYDQLIDDTPPFTWTWTNAALRIAEIFAIGQQIGETESRILRGVEPRKSYLTPSVGVSDADAYLAAICQEWATRGQ